ncbi:MAG: type I glyceraldehyde-3-phosphate dehydrogenase [Bacteroidetes bacterium]|nr:type I glyceraldehyde-3-phosphate dehydrogenase [Bacteroidota bacterium]
MIKVAINGFGRIGRYAFKALLEKKNIAVSAINDLSSPDLMGHLLKYDSIHGIYSKDVSINNNILNVDNTKIKLFNEKNPEDLPWKKLEIDIVIEATGKFLTEELAFKHITAGAKKVITTAPLKEGEAPTIVMGINQNILNGSEKIISNASCTTNCLAPMVKIIDDNFGINKGFINTIHAYTADQNLQDGPHKDFRRARAASQSIIPTSTGAAKAVGLILPHLNGKLDGLAMRVPVVNGSIIDFTAQIQSETSKEEINNIFQLASKNYLKGILQYNQDPIVSVDILGNTHSCIFDSELTYVNENLIKVIGWYDNEAGYSHRIVDLIETIF